MPEVRRSFCRFCHANCAMLVTIDGGRVTKVQGDPDDPVFGGYTCIKGRQLPEAHHGPQRLTVSQKRVDGVYQDIAMDTALDEIGAKLSAIIAEHGPHAIAIYAGTYSFQNSAGVGSAMAFAQGLGTRNIYTSVTLDQPAKVYTTMRYGNWMGGMHTFAEADVAFFIGNNPIVSHYGPPGGLPPFSPSRRLRDALDKGLKLIVADPRESDVAALAHIHLPVRPGEDPAMLAGIIHVILAEGLYDKGFVQQYVDGLDDLTRAVADFTPAVAAARAGVEESQLVAAARMFAGGTKGVVSTGTGPEMAGKRHADPISRLVAQHHLRAVLPRGREKLDPADLHRRHPRAARRSRRRWRFLARAFRRRGSAASPILAWRCRATSLPTKS